MCQRPVGWHALRGAGLAAIAAAVSCREGAPAAPPRQAPPPAAAALAPPVSPDTLPLVPRPRVVRTCPGTFAIDPTTPVRFDPAAAGVAAHLATWLGIEPARVLPRGDDAARAIVLEVEGAGREPSVAPPAATSEEAFTLDVDARAVRVRASTAAGAFYGAQALAQLAGARPIGAVAARALRPVPCAHVEDEPRYRVRAMHLDVARHFFSREEVERYVDLLAFYRFNVLHWHLTDDQGFRFAVRSRPELTEVGARRDGPDGVHAGHYTQADARTVVEHARARFVTVVPEIEMPGHARAILASHPELSCTGRAQPVPATWGVFEDVLCAGNEATYALVGDVLREVTDVFPSHLVHVGGDEVPKARWSSCPKCRAAMAREKIDAEGLQGRFLARVGAMLHARGRRVLAWDDALEGGLPEDGAVVAWQGLARAEQAARAGHDVLVAPGEVTYFNYWQSRSGAEPGHEGLIPWTRVLAFEPTPPGLDARAAARVLGGEGALWTEYVTTQEHLDTLVLPRMAALAEALWSAPPASERSFAARFASQRRLLDASGVRYFVAPPEGLRAKKVFLDEATAEIARPAIHPDGVVRFTLDGSEPTSASPVFAPTTVRETTRVAARLFLPGGRVSPVVRAVFERAALSPALVRPRATPGVRFTYVEGDFRRVPDFATLAPKARGRLPEIGFAPSFRAERFAVLYQGYLRAPADGVYRLVARADDGVVVEVDDQVVLSDDGEHEARESDGEVALAAGLHALRVRYFQGAEGKALSLSCEGPGRALAACEVLTDP